MPEKLNYGLGQCGLSAIEIFTRLHLLIFFTDVVGISAATAGIALSLGVLVGASLDPLMGRFSDRVRTPIGFRRPFLLIAALGLAICVYGLFHPPNWGSGTLAIVALVLFLGYNILYTTYHVPYMALGSELGRDRHEITIYYAWRLGFGGLGAIFGAALPILVLQIAPNFSLGQRYGRAGLMLACLVLVAGLIPALFVRERAKPVADQSTWSQDFQRLHKNRVFWPYYICFFVATLAFVTNSSLALYFYKYRLQLPEFQVNVIMATFVGVFLLSLPLWVGLSKLFGKLPTLRAGALGLGCLVTFTYPFMPEHQFWPPMIVGIFTGVFSGAIVLMDSILTDIIDYDELFSGNKKSGLYFGVWRVGEKASRATAMFLSSQFLAWMEFVPNQPLGESSRHSLALMFGPGVGVLLILAGFILCFYRYGDAQHLRVLTLIERARNLRPLNQTLT